MLHFFTILTHLSKAKINIYNYLELQKIETQIILFSVKKILDPRTKIHYHYLSY